MLVGHSWLRVFCLLSKYSGHRSLLYQKRLSKLLSPSVGNSYGRGNVDASKKAFIAWEKLCCPRSNGGMNFLDLYTWNKAVLAKLL